MKLTLLALPLLLLSIHAQDTAAPPAGALPFGGKVVIDNDGRKEILDLTDPATIARLKGKVIITTEINGKRETRVVDMKDADKLPPPFLWNEKPPVRTGPVTFLGIGAIEVPDEIAAQLPLAPETGLLLAIILPDSPASGAGLQENDVLQKFEDQILVTPRQLSVLIANRKEGDTVKLSVLRKGAPMEITATLGKRDVPHTAESPNPVANVTREIVKVGDREDASGTQAEKDSIKEALLNNSVIVRGGYQVMGQQAKPPTEPPASQDVRRDIRRALDKLPAESRPVMERLLIESGALPSGK